MDPRRPAPIPDGEWDAASTVRALRDRDAQALVRLARKYGASQHYLSGRAMYLTNGSLTQNQISLIANGRTRVEKLEVWERLAAAMDMPDRARIRLGLAPLSDTVGADHPERDGDLESMRRNLADAFGTSTVTESGVEDWERTALMYGRATRNTTPATLLNGVTTDFADLTTQLRARQPARLQRRLCFVAARFAGLVSLLLTNLAQYDQARRWGRTARLAADEAADPALASWVRAQDAYALFYQGGNYRSAIDVARHAQQLGGHGDSVGVALSAALEARACAVVGDEGDALDAIGRAEHVLSTLDAQATEPSAFGYNEAQLRFHEGNALTHLGKTEQAWTAQRRALDLYPVTDTLDRTLVHLDRATSLASAGEVEAAATYAVTKLLALDAVQRTDIVVARTRQLATLLDNHRALPAVRDLRALTAGIDQPNATRGDE